MKIVYDAQIFALQEFGGISRYFCSLAEQISRRDDAQAKILAPLHVNRYLKDLADVAVGCYVPRVPKTGRLIRGVNAALFRPLAAALRADLVHETYYTERVRGPGKVPHVLTVYDMIHERFPGSFPAQDPVAKLKAVAVHRADHVFCISENTRRDLLEIHDWPEERISVTYPGCDKLPESGTLANEFIGASPYLLYVGMRYGYKNFQGLVRALASSAWLKGNFRIVCFGGGPFSGQERNLFVELGLTEKDLLQLGGGDDRLAALYRGAAAFVYPSQYEGFGIPPLEAMFMDCPVICSDTSSMPEVVGDAGEFFDPLDTGSIRSALERVLQSPQRRAELIKRGYSRRLMFNWERCAQETMSVYRRLV